MTSTWTVEERLRDDERSSEQLVSRANAAIAKWDAARAEAERTNREGFYSYGPAERQERTAEADADWRAFLQEETADVDKGIALIDGQLVDNGARANTPLTWASDADQARAERVRANVRREVPRSTVAEIEQQAGLATRSGDWIVARVWMEEIGEFANSLPVGDTRRGPLGAAAGRLDVAATNPALEKERKQLAKRLEGRKEGRRKFWDAVRPHQVDVLTDELRASGRYARF